MGTSLLLGAAMWLAGQASGAAAPTTGRVLALDGPWLLACDPQNVGRAERWWEQPRPDARPTPVPWIIQEVFPGQHGVAWYWLDFTPPEHPCPGGRHLLRFWAVDYLADVWLNGVHLGQHEGGEEPFVLDATETLRPGAANRLAVRVLNPIYEPIDGIVLTQTPRRNKTHPYSPGSDYNYGGITDAVDLLLAPAVRVEDLFVRPDWKTGVIRIQATVRNASAQPADGRIAFSVAPAASGETLQAADVTQRFEPGETKIETELRLAEWQAWELNSPFLYRVTARVAVDGAAAFDEVSARCGFRDFRFAGGSFRLNGRRIFLKSSHSGADTPVGIRVAYDRDLLRRDLLNCKAMGFNMIRFIAGVPQRYQLDLCDEVGLLVYEENFASWLLGESPQMATRFDRSTVGMIRRDRNHPSVVAWGLLNETGPNSVFFKAVASLPLVRTWDDSRLVFLNSGGFDNYTRSGVPPGPATWRVREAIVPNVTKNLQDTDLFFDGTTWPPHTFALHPGINGEYSAVRWTAPAAGRYEVQAVFKNVVIHGVATTDLHIVAAGRAVFDGFLNVQGHGPQAEFSQTLEFQAGETLDVVVGIGDGRPFGDTTALTMTIKSADGTTHDVTADFATEKNPNGVWSYGYLAPGEQPDLATFMLLPMGEGETRMLIGRVANPGSREWENVVSDQHPYQPLPHNRGVIQTLRTVQGGDLPVWLSEYGIGSALDLARLARHYEQLGKTECEDAVAYRRYLDAFLADWERWRMGEAFANPEDYFRQCLTWMADLRLLGINAIRANPNVIGYSLTGTHDQGLTGEGLTTTFRELKPGTIDALFDAFAPLRLCLFVEPVQVYRGGRVRLEAVLANEDMLAPGEYPVRLLVVGPDQRPVLDRTVTVTIPEPSPDASSSFALPVFADDVTIDGVAGEYRFLAAFQQGAAAAGGEAKFIVADPAEMPAVPTEVVLWGADDELARWLREHGIATQPFAADAPAAREVILVGRQPAAGEAAAFAELTRHIARGSHAVFLCPEVFKRGDNAAGWLPLVNKGTLAGLPVWVYHKDDWAKPHPIFAGLPAGCVLDHAFFREVFSNVGWSGQDLPAEAVAGAINTSSGYSSGLTVCVYDLGAGRFTLNTLRIRDNLGSDPVAERLLRNMLIHAAKHAGEPAADLPPEFDAFLKSLNY